MTPLNDSKSSKGANSKKAHRLWTPEETEKLRSLLSNKSTLSEISEAFQRSAKSIRRKCETLEISSATVYKKGKPTPLSPAKETLAES